MEQEVSVDIPGVVERSKKIVSRSKKVSFNCLNVLCILNLGVLVWEWCLTVC
jgi:hypothetical protein